MAADHVFKYNPSDRTYSARLTRASGQVDELTFDAGGGLCSKARNGEFLLRIEQDARLRVTTVGRARTTEEFDEQGRLSRRTHPDGGIESKAITGWSATA
jgi:YD repeat-containing protein